MEPWNIAGPRQSYRKFDMRKELTKHLLKLASLITMWRQIFAESTYRTHHDSVMLNVLRTF